MQITNIRLFKSQFADGAKAFGSLELDNSIVLDIEVREGQKGPFVCFPGYKTVKDKTTGQDKKQSRIFVKDEALRAAINTEVVGKYRREMAGGAATDGYANPLNDNAGSASYPF